MGKIQAKADSWTSKLSIDEQNAVYEFAKAHNYEEVIKHLKKNYAQCALPTISAYYRWRARWNTEEQIEKNKASIEYALEIRTSTTTNKVDYEALSTANTALAESASVRGKYTEMMMFHTMAKDYHRMHIDEAKLALLKEEAKERREQRAEATKALATANLTDEERQQRLREIFSIGGGGVNG